MKTVDEYRAFARACRELAERIADPNDRRALELQAIGWEKVAAEREAALAAGIRPMTGPLEPSE